MRLTPILFLLPAIAMGWVGTRAAQHIRHSKGSRGDALFMLAVCWSPLVVCLLALLLALSGSNP